MAKENKVFLQGQVYTKPVIVTASDGTRYRASFYIKVLRRPYSPGQVVANRLYTAFPKIMSRNAEIIDNISLLKEGDMVEIKGVMTTREVIKETLCTFCRHPNRSEGNDTYVTPIYIKRMEEDISEEDGFVLLKERSEVSNNVMLMGSLCRDPAYYEDQNGKRYAQYQMAVNRKYRIKEDPEYVKTDFPWIKTFGEQALKDAEGLHTGSWVYIDGALQTRNIERTTVCGHCGAEYKWEEIVMEVVPYSTEYLANCDFPEPIQP